MLGLLARLDSGLDKPSEADLNLCCTEHGRPPGFRINPISKLKRSWAAQARWPETLPWKRRDRVSSGQRQRRAPAAAKMDGRWRYSAPPSVGGSRGNNPNELHSSHLTAQYARPDEARYLVLERRSSGSGSSRKHSRTARPSGTAEVLNPFTVQLAAGTHLGRPSGGNGGCAKTKSLCLVSCSAGIPTRWTEEQAVRSRHAGEQTIRMGEGRSALGANLTATVETQNEERLRP